MKNKIVLSMLLSLLFAGQIAFAQKTASLNETEASEMQYMIEEEKLARDVYLVLNEKWNITAFANISTAEQRHFDRMKALASQYDLKISVTVLKDEPGKFQNKELQNAYNEMVKTGSSSLKEALRVGAKIEEMDIKDLTEAIANTEQENILLVYRQLKQASEKHLQSFNANLLTAGVTYTPVILSQKDFDAIIGAKAACKGGEKTRKACCNKKKGKSANATNGCEGKKGKANKGKACCKKASN